MIRRVFLGFGLMLLGFGRGVWAQLTDSHCVTLRSAAPSGFRSIP